MGNKWNYLPFTEAVEVNPSIRLKRGETYPFVDMKAVESSSRCASESEFREFKSGGARFMPFDTLMARITPCLENGKIARYIPSEGIDGPAFGSTEFIVIRGREGITDNDYAYYLTKWEEFRQFAISQMTGSSGRQRVPADSLAKFLAPVPENLSEQRAIAHILGTLDDKIELNRQMNRTLEAMAQALFKSWFIDFDPVVVNALRAGNPVPEKFAQRAAHYRDNPDALRLPEETLRLFPDRFQDSELGPIPEGWNIQTMEQVTQLIRRGISPKYIENDGVLVINQRCIRNHSINFDLARRNDTKQRKIEGREINIGDVLINSTGVGTLGRVAQVLYLNEKTVVDSHVTVIRPDPSRFHAYVFGQLMFSMEKNFEAMGEGSTGQTELSRAKLKEIKLLAPSINCQLALEAHLKNISLQKATLEKENIILAKTRDTLLPKLISGELRVPDAEKLLEKT